MHPIWTRTLKSAGSQGIRMCRYRYQRPVNGFLEGFTENTMTYNALNNKR